MDGSGAASHYAVVEALSQGWPVVIKSNAKECEISRAYRNRVKGFEGDFGKGSNGWLDYWFE